VGVRKVGPGHEGGGICGEGKRIETGKGAGPNRGGGLGSIRVRRRAWGWLRLWRTLIVKGEQTKKQVIKRWSLKTQQQWEREKREKGCEESRLGGGLSKRKGKENSVPST